MSADFKVIRAQRAAFGNELSYVRSLEKDVPFFGPTTDFTFDCPNVNSNEVAVLMFQSRDVDSKDNVLSINDHVVFGGIPVSPNKDTWNGNVMLISEGVLKETANRLHIESRNDDGEGGGDIDDFILDNIVTMYKTR